MQSLLAMHLPEERSRLVWTWSKATGGHRRRGPLGVCRQATLGASSRGGGVQGDLR